MQTFKRWPLLLSFAIVGCAAIQGNAVQTTTTTSANLPPPNANGQYTVRWPDEGSGDARFITINLGPDLHQMCRDVSPKFPFDSSTTYVEDDDQLLALASCLNHPGLESRHVKLVGRADPRGTVDYNVSLGMRRANAIKEFLVKAGLAENRIDMESLGKRDAKGMLPEYSFGYDRRVDIVVTGGAHHP